MQQSKWRCGYMINEPYPTIEIFLKTNLEANRRYDRSAPYKYDSL